MNLFEALYRSLSLSIVLLAVALVLSIMGSLAAIVFGILIHSDGKAQPWHSHVQHAAMGLLALNVVCLLYIAYARWDWISHRGEAQGVVIYSDVEEWVTSKFRKRELVSERRDQFIKVEYAFEGADRPGVAIKGVIMAEEPAASNEEAWEIVGKLYAQEQPITVYYDTRNPESNTTYEYPGNARFSNLVGHFIFSLYFAGFLFLLHRMAQRV